MLLTDLADYRNRTKGKRLLGLDIGTKTIGLAVADVNHTLASPLHTIRRTRFTADAEHLRSIILEHEIGGLVAGLPLNMNGTEGPRCQSVRQFCRNLEKTGIDLPLWFQDERLSTVAALDLLEAHSDLSHSKRAEKVDKLAASYILRGFLERGG